MIDWNGTNSFELNLFIQFPFFANEIDTFWPSTVKKLGKKSQRVFLKYFANILFFILLILIQLWKTVCCLLFQRWIQLKDKIFDDLLDQTNCAITPWFFFCVFLFCFVLCTQTSFLPCYFVCMQISYYKLCDEAEGKKVYSEKTHFSCSLLSFGEILN